MKPFIVAALLSLALPPLSVLAQGAEAPAPAGPVGAARPVALPEPVAVAAPVAVEAAARGLAPAASTPAGQTPGAEAAGPARWSLGAGMGFTVGPRDFLWAYPFPDFLLSPSAPTARASVERSLRSGRWLVLGVEGWTQRNRSDAPGSVSRTTRFDSNSIAVSAGLRQAFTPAGAPVCLSGLLLATAGYGWSRQDYSGAAPWTFRGEAWSVGASAGLAVDRELSAGLTLRVATPLLSLNVGRSSSDRSDLGGRSGSTGGLSLGLAPSLELRLAF